ncbi:Delta(6)-protoilludene synthase [Leucoagaricus sp. SymC.cos]|nr:Delta(6)-protoilludene synthase [Leucoagaricus sp. SymC.cos]
MPNTDRSYDLPESYYLPDLLAELHWPRLLSEHYEEIKAESSAWIESFNPFNQRGLEAFRAGDFSLLSALTYAPREKVIIRLGADLMNLFFTFDEYTDIETHAGAIALRNIVDDAFRNPEKPRPEREHCLGAIARDFWNRARSIVAPNDPCLKHFINDWEGFSRNGVQEAEDRMYQKSRGFFDYLPIRRHTSGSYPTLALCEFGLNLPEEVYNHPIFVVLRDQAAELIALINDVYSLAMERSRGLNWHNSVVLVMREQNVSLPEAMDWILKYGQKVVRSFNANVEALPSWGPDVDKRVALYVQGIAQNIRGVDDWTFESHRYFGPKGLDIKLTRTMSPFPPGTGYVRMDEEDHQPVPVERIALFQPTNLIAAA